MKMTGWFKNILYPQCSGCNDAWFCSAACQQQNWSHHKGICRQHKTDIKNGSKLLKTKFDIYRRSSRPLDMPYYFGNSLPVDMLKLKGNEWNGCSDQSGALCQSYSILSIGCGNIRNVAYTITSLPEKFSGKLSVTLNDLDPFVLARNVLFLYLMITYSTLNDISLTLTTLWYSLHLTEMQYRLIIDSLRSIIDCDSESLESATSGVVCVNESDLSILRQVWQKWIDIKCEKADPDSINLREQREKMFADDQISAEGIQVYKQQIPKKYHQSVDDWIQNGVFVPNGFDRSKLTYDNPTLTGRKIGKSPWHIGEALNGDCKRPADFTFVYCIPTDLWPFGAWDILKVNDLETSSKSLIDIFHQYVVSQIQTTIQYLSSGRMAISIVNCDCLKLGERFRSNHTKAAKTYDRIFTSNVADYVGTATLLRAIKPLLNLENKHAVIVTQYWNWYGLFPETLVDSELAVKDGTNAKCFEAARKDTRQKFTMASAPRFWVQEYFNNTSWFLKYLRADVLACSNDVSSNEKPMQVPSFQEVKNIDGFRMRDFRRELNKVTPFRYRRNVRPVNMLRGMSRMVEWHVQ